MIVRAVCVAAPAALALVGSGLTVLPAVAPSPTAPDSSTLSAILPDPLDPAWVESPVEAAQYFDGPVTYENVRSYYTYYHQTETFIEAAINLLQEHHFVAGYQRMWYRPNTADTLSETIYVFATPADVTSEMAAAKAEMAGMSGVSTTYFDPGVGSTSYGALATISQVNFVNVFFVKGNAGYVTSLISDRKLAPDYVIPQATLLWNHAPATIALATPARAHLPFGSKDWMFVIAGLWVMVSVAVIAVVLVIVLFAPRRTAAAATSSIPEPPPS